MRCTNSTRIHMTNLLQLLYLQFRFRVRLPFAQSKAENQGVRVCVCVPMLVHVSLYV